MKVIAQHFYGTTEEWKTANPKLYNAVWGFEEVREGDKTRVLAKLGNGVDRWNDLKYFDVNNIYGLEEQICEISNLAQESSDKVDKKIQEFENSLHELSESYEKHNKDGESHPDIRDWLENANEKIQAAGTALSSVSQNVSDLTENVTRDLDEIRGKLQASDNETEGAGFIKLEGAFLTRVINGVTEVQKNLLDETAFAPNRTVINDGGGTVGVYINEKDSAAIIVRTVSVSPVGADETPNLGTAQNNSDLPLTITEAETKWGRTPGINSYATVLTDETKGGMTVEWYITGIDGNGDITWGNFRLINTGDYQQQTTAAEAGLVLTGGAAAGTFGKSLPVDNEAVENSPNLITSGAVFEKIKLSGNTRSATAVIGSLLSGHKAAEVDYLCTGENDDLVIKQAIQELPGGGGEIVIREGVFNLSSGIIVERDNVTLRGMGVGTVLNGVHDINMMFDVLHGVRACVFKGLNFKNNHDKNILTCILFRGYTQHCKVEDCFINTTTLNGESQGIVFQSDYGSVINCLIANKNLSNTDNCNGMKLNGINICVKNNTVINKGGAVNIGIFLYKTAGNSCEGIIVAHNIISNNDGVINNLGVSTRGTNSYPTNKSIISENIFMVSGIGAFALHINNENNYNIVTNNNLRCVIEAGGAAFTRNGTASAALPGSATTIGALNTGGSCGFNIV